MEGLEPRGKDKRWSPVRPYHAALDACENWDQVNDLCKFNRVPFDPTGERCFDSRSAIAKYNSQCDTIDGIR